MHRQLSSVALLFICVHVVNSRVIPLSKRAFSYIANDTVCVVDNAIYYDGDPIPTDDPCEFCRCRPPGFSCVLRECEMKPGCKAIRREGECCPEYQCGCEHNGNFFKDGDKIPIAESPCYSCYCQGSSITCALADCKFRFDCPPEYVKGDCCPRYDHCPPESSIFTRPPHETLATTINVTQISFESTTPFEINDNHNLQTTKSTFTELATISTAISTSTTASDSDKKDSDQSSLTTPTTVLPVVTGSSEVFNFTTNDYINERVTQESKISKETTVVTKKQESVDVETESLLGDGATSTTTEYNESVSQKSTTALLDENKTEITQGKSNPTEKTAIDTSPTVFITTDGVTKATKEQSLSTSETTTPSQVSSTTTTQILNSTKPSQVSESTTPFLVSESTTPFQVFESTIINNGIESETSIAETTTAQDVDDVTTISKAQVSVNDSKLDEDVASTVASQPESISTTKLISIQTEKTTIAAILEENKEMNRTETKLPEIDFIGDTKTLSPIMTVATEKMETKPTTESATEVSNDERETTLASKNSIKNVEKEEPSEISTEELQTTEFVTNNDLSTGTDLMFT